MGLTKRVRRLRHRAELLAAILVLLSVPVLWSLFQQTDPASVRPVARPVTQARALPQAPAAAQTPRDGAVEAGREKPRAGGCDDPKILVDRAHALPADYAPDDLVSLPVSGSRFSVRTRCFGGRRRGTSNVSWHPPRPPAKS